MNDVIFCLVCHHKISADAKLCNFCGAPVARSKPPERSTLKVAPIPVRTAGLDVLHKRYSPKLPDNTFALFILDESEPLIIENSEAIYLGRFAQNPTSSSVDLTQYGAAEMGVSRSHARIKWSEGIYEIEDLASSNGTWLNYQRLAYGTSYELHNGDIILLGQLQLTICLPESTRNWEVNFDVRRNKTVDTVYLQILTPYFMEKVLSKFLQAIVDLQQICLLSRAQHIEDVHILSIRAALQSPVLHISLDNANEAVHYIRKWVNPLRQSYAEKTSIPAPVERPGFQDDMLKTIHNILLDINPGLDEAARNGFAEQMKPAVISLISSELEITSL
jgi:hypothetical protein